MVDKIAHVLESLASHRELTQLFGVTDENGSKPVRIANHVLADQRVHDHGGELIRLIETLLQPMRFVGPNNSYPREKVETIRAILAFADLNISDSGRVEAAESPGEDESDDGQFRPEEQRQALDMLTELTKRVEALEAQGKATKAHIARWRKKSRELEQSITKISRSSWRDQAVGAFIAAGIGAIVNRENLSAVTSALGILPPLPPPNS